MRRFGTASTFRGIIRRRVSTTLAATLLVLSWHWPTAAWSQVVDLALVLAVDVSNSVDAEEYRLQMQGIADAETLIVAGDEGLLGVVAGSTVRRCLNADSPAERKRWNNVYAAAVFRLAMRW